MGIGAARKVKIVVVGQTEGVDGPDVTADEVANLWAQINTITQNRGFDASGKHYNPLHDRI